LRLYTRHDHDARPEHDLPEILREDLSETLLAVAAMGGGADLAWLDPPPAAAWEAARLLLARLGAVDGAGSLTALGRRMARYPVHPRLARLVVEAAARGAPAGGALLAAILGERDLRERRALEGAALPPTGPSDLLELAHLFEEAARARFDPDRVRRLGLVPGAAQAIDRSRRQLERLARGERGSPAASARIPAATSTSTSGTDSALLLATLAAYPDRVARRRAPGSDEVVLAGGGSARLDPASVVREAPLLVAVDAGERRGDRRGAGRGEVRVRIASAATAEMLLELFPEALRYEEALSWNEAAGRVDAVERLLYGDLVLEETRAARADPEKVSALLAEQALSRGPRAFAEEGEIDRLLARMAFAAEHAPAAGIAPPTEEDLSRALRSLCAGRRSLAELHEGGLPAALLAGLPPAARAALERLAPERVTLPGGRSVRVGYAAGKPPWIESRLQDFFGMADGPSVAGGKVPLVLHLLAPNQRAVQVTTDLSGFWARHYPALRRELGRRYPRHAWPEDPRTAAPAARRR
ncbi:MAG TPA: ATP-dependent helicase C-terminal domain-containing protein, partial [Anaeromyxobacteraceae bacterium]|nr:ATP-dependent helicase C-terminal domain-containing protein [Anaeromyxobacteraceae bacterium]